MLALITLALPVGQTLAASRLTEFVPKAQPAELVPGAERLGSPEGDPPLVPAYRGDRLLGYVYLNSDFTNAVGYSGKPIHLLVGIDLEGVITGIKLVEHKEPIVLVGIPEKRIIEAINKLVGKNIGPVASGAARPPQVDIVSGATVTVLVMADSVVRSAVRLIRSGRLSGPAQAGTAA
ncbi:MAG TPA: FMN-binding protein, partial [Xanthobacteraceae bacterium]